MTLWIAQVHEPVFRFFDLDLIPGKLFFSVHSSSHFFGDHFPNIGPPVVRSAAALQRVPSFHREGRDHTVRRQPWGKGVLDQHDGGGNLFALTDGEANWIFLLLMCAAWCIYFIWVYNDIICVMWNVMDGVFVYPVVWVFVCVHGCG